MACSALAVRVVKVAVLLLRCSLDAVMGAGQGAAVRAGQGAVWCAQGAAWCLFGDAVRALVGVLVRDRLLLVRGVLKAQWQSRAVLIC